MKACDGRAFAGWFPREDCFNFGIVYNVYKQFANRLKSAAEGACDGWGFYDEMKDLYLQIDWINHEEE